MTHVVALVQARMSSQRLPGKVLRPLPSSAANETDLVVLDWVVRRTRRAATVDEVVVATSDQGDDDAIVQHCETNGYRFFRGSLDDVLARMYEAARAHSTDVVVRVTADCPLVDPGVIDEVVQEHLQGGHDYTANRLPPPNRRTYPIGLDIEVANMEAFATAAHEATSKAHREHVMPFLYESSGRFKVHVCQAAEDAGSVRWTVDTEEDLDAVRRLISVAGGGLETGWLEFLQAWGSHPELAALNSRVVQRTAGDVDPR